MPKYIVKRPEVHYQNFEVEADNPQAALQRVRDGEDDETCCELDFVYDRTLGPDDWVVTDPEHRVVQRGSL